MLIVLCYALLLLKSEGGLMVFVYFLRHHGKINFIRNCVVDTPKLEKCAIGILYDCMYLYPQSDSVLL
jgi:hypothetical protein